MSATESQTGVVTTLLGRRVRLYDLSQEVSQRTQMHPLHPRVEVYPFESHANSKQVLGTGFSYRACLLIMSDHASTHLDAHCHFDPDPSAATIDQLPLDLCCGEAICIDLSHLPPRGPASPLPTSGVALAKRRSRAPSRATSCCSTRATTSVRPALPST